MKTDLDLGAKGGLIRSDKKTEFERPYLKRAIPIGSQTMCQMYTFGTLILIGFYQCFFVRITYF